MTPRAPALPPEERRAAIVEAAAPLLLSDPSRFTTRAVAEAAGLAEGTVFRHFATKAELVSTVLAHLLDPAEACLAIGQLDGDDLEQRLSQIIDLLRERFHRHWTLMGALASLGQMPDLHGPAGPAPQPPTWGRMPPLHDAIIESLRPFEGQLRHPLERVAGYVVTASLTSSHPALQADGITTCDLVGLLLHGLLTSP